MKDGKPWSASDEADFDPILFSLNGIIVSLIVLAVFGVLAVSGKYSSGMIRITFTSTPSRSRVLAAKITLVAVATALIGTVSTLGPRSGPLGPRSVPRKAGQGAAHQA